MEAICFKLKQSSHLPDLALRLYQLCQDLDEQQQEKDRNKLEELREIKESLDEQALQPKNNAIGRGTLNIDACGPSSAQQFSGEDHNFDVRVRRQQQQLKGWCYNGVDEKESKAKLDKQKEEDYARCVIEEDKLRYEVALEKQEQRAEIQASVNSDNLQLTNERRRQMLENLNEAKRLEAEEMKYVLTSPFFCEDTNYTKSAISGHRVRPDHFKGFSNGQIKEVFQLNDEVVKEKEALRMEEKALENRWATQQMELIAYTEEMEKKKQENIAKENKIQADTIKIQREESKKKKAQMDQDRFGSIGYGFFQKFGTSCR